MSGHHLILGEIKDFITGKFVKETHDERYRQKIARILVNIKGYKKARIKSQNKFIINVDNKKAMFYVDFIINNNDKIHMLIKYAPGSIVTRHRSVLAASRLVSPYQVPVAVVTNGQTADILEGDSGKVLYKGLNSIPSKAELVNLTENYQFRKISSKQVEIESRIIYAYEIDGACPCDNSICKL